MKKIITAVLLIAVLLITKKEVYAKTYTDTFYAGEYITTEYIKKEKTNYTEFKQHRFINRTSDQRPVYCLSPWDKMNEGESYTGYDTSQATKASLTSAVWNKVRLISYYGYGYDNHTAKKWYTITQMMIWKEIDKNSTFTWTDKLSGDTITKYESEMNEINKLVENHKKLPSYANNSYTISINKPFIINDANFNIGDFDITSTLTYTKTSTGANIKTNTPGYYEMKFTNEDTKYNTKPIVYTNPNSQDILVVGSNDTITFKVNITIESGSIKAHLLDKETKNNTPQGAASLKGAEYNLLDENNNIIKQIKLGDNLDFEQKDLEYGEYCLEQTKSGEGYLKDGEKHCFTINHENLNIELELYNEVIKEEVLLTKYKKEEEKLTPEADISFKITGVNHDYEKTLITNSEGKANIILPYGKYLFTQLNTSKDYDKVKDFILEVDGLNELHKYNLIDNLIKKENTSNKQVISKKIDKKEDDKNTYNLSVPNTGISKNSINKILFLVSSSFFLITIVYEKHEIIKANII